ncbi:hypothetical protein ACKUSY_07935 [Myroides odoratus]
MKDNYHSFLEIYYNRKKHELDDKFIWSRYYLDDYSFDKRVGFVTEFVKDDLKKEFLLEIKFWENTQTVVNLLKEVQEESYIVEEYKGGEAPGILVIQDCNLNKVFFTQLVQFHYNFELAKSPSLNIKLLLFIDTVSYLKVYDFYDDRGFLVNFYFK